MDKLKATNIELSNKNDELEKEKLKLQETNKKLEESNKKLEDSNKSLTNSVNELKDQSNYSNADNNINSGNKQGYIVYIITATGGKYHSLGCRYLRKSCYEIDISDAKAQGYTPCSRCSP